MDGPTLQLGAGSDPESLPLSYSSGRLPALHFYCAARSTQTDARLLQFAYSQSNRRRAFLEAFREFSGFVSDIGIVDLAQVEPIHGAAFVEAQLKTQSKPTVNCA